MIRQTRFPDRLAILANRTYQFEIPALTDGRSLISAGEFDLPAGIKFLATECGLLAFNFEGSDLGGFTKLEFTGSGAVPPEVMSNRDELIALQIRRIRLAVYVAACVYGTHISVSHTSLRDPLFPGLADIFGWDYLGQGVALPANDYALLQRVLPGADELKRFSSLN
jgi:hypothetical protein